MLLTQSRIVEIAPGDHFEVRIDAAVEENDLLRRMLRKLDRLVDEALVMHGLAGAHAGIRGEHEFWFRVIDARSEAVRGETAEYDGVNRAEANAGEHRECRLRHHRHVDQDAVALADTLRAQHRRAAVDLCDAIRETCKSWSCPVSVEM